MTNFYFFIFAYLISVNSPIYTDLKIANGNGLVDVDLSCLPIDTRNIKILRKPKNTMEENFLKRLRLKQNKQSLKIQEDRGEVIANIIKKNFFWQVNLYTKP